jgi:ankyrin repeat protein
LNDVNFLIEGRNEIIRFISGRHRVSWKEYVNRKGRNSLGEEYTPLGIAAENEHFQIVKCLIEQGEADPNIAGRYGRTPLGIAARNEHFQLVQYLIEQCKVDPNIGDSDGYNALHYAASYNKKNTELIELLLTHMSLNSINKKGRDILGYTPLNNAYYNKSPIKQKIIDLIRLKGGKRRNEL